jgi:hypothetical protein
VTAPAATTSLAAANTSRVAGANAGRTIAVLVGLTLTLPVDLAVVGAALLGRASNPLQHRDIGGRRTVLINGAKMTKALTLARAFHAAGHRVVMVESDKYRFTGHRFSRAVDAFHRVPEPGTPGYGQALRDVVRDEGIDVFVPVSSPAGSVPDAEAGRLLAGLCEVLHLDPDTARMLDDKASFSSAAAELGLRVPDFLRITDAQQVIDFDFPVGRSYILKRIAYNPVGRMDLTRLSRDTPQRNAALARSLHITAQDPWILQEFIEGREYCTHGTVRDGSLQVYGCCESSAFQINYSHVHKPEIRCWVEDFVGALELTGQVSFDFIEAADGHAYAIECNPRTHSAITMFYDHPEVAAAYLLDDHPVITPRLSAKPTHWLYHEMWRLLTTPGRRRRIAEILTGKDAIFDWWDPLPYLMVHHLHIPSLLWRNLRRRQGWTRIDFNIGKLVENGGD